MIQSCIRYSLGRKRMINATMKVYKSFNSGNVPIQAGMEPLSRLFCIVKSCRCVRLLKELGMVLENALL